MTSKPYLSQYLKQLNGAEFQPAVPHNRKQQYTAVISELQKFDCNADRLLSNLNLTLKNEQYKYLAEYALSGSAFFLRQTGCKANFEQLCIKLRKEYRAYTDKAHSAQKQRNLRDKMSEVSRELKQSARTYEQSVETAKKLYQLADYALRICADETENIAENCEFSEQEIDEEVYAQELS